MAKNFYLAIFCAMFQTFDANIQNVKDAFLFIVNKKGRNVADAGPFFNRKLQWVYGYLGLYRRARWVCRMLSLSAVYICIRFERSRYHEVG